MATEDNALFYGDNLEILKRHIRDESVDLVYLDPPFNSNRSYNVLFADESGREAESQITAFEDTWHWGPATDRLFCDLAETGPPRVSSILNAIRQALGANQMTAYLVMMAARLVELHRALKPTGSLYLHCDPTASHYLKIVLDSIFEPVNFRSEISWKRTSAHSDAKQGRAQHGRIHDTILYFTKGKSWTWNQVYTPYDPQYVETFYRYIEEGTGRRYRTDNLTAAKPGGDTLYDWKGVKPYKGRYWAYSKEKMEQFERDGRLYYTKTGMPCYKRYLDEMPGIPLQDLWTDIPPALGGQSLGYSTQKPLALLERIVQSSSNKGDLVLDPFCGCGTTVAAAEKLKRRWIGIDITHLSISLMKYRLKDMYGIEPKRDYSVIGEPQDIGAAAQLAQDNRHQFEWWALSLVKARPAGGQPKKGKDRGIDGVIAFVDNAEGNVNRALVQVKSGKVKSGDIRDLRGVVEREKAAMGIFITLEPPTRDMIAESAAGYYRSPGWNKDYPRLQILTIEELLAGKSPEMPPSKVTFKEAEKVAPKGHRQNPLF